MKEKIVVGKIFGAHGIRGDLKVYPLTDDKNRFKLLKTCYIDNKEYNITSVKFHKETVLLNLNGIDTRNDAEAMKNKHIEIDRSEAAELNENEFFIEDLKGLDAFDNDGNKVGKMTDVITSAAVDVYVFKDENTSKEFMLTAMKENILEINLDANKVVINLKNKVESN